MIRVEHVSKRFGSFVALSDASFRVDQGETFVLLGPNGSGKTTLLKTIVGLIVPSSGKVFVHGLDIAEHPVGSRRLISYLPQQVVFPEVLSAREILRFYCRLRGLPEETARNVLSTAWLNGFADKPVGEFSGGMVQRLGMAVVALPDAPILLLDEPTASLDPQGVKRFREFVTRQKGEGKTVIFSTHLLTEAEELADHVAIFVGGRLVAQESVQGLKDTYQASKTLENMYLHYVEQSEVNR